MLKYNLNTWFITEGSRRTRYRFRATQRTVKAHLAAPPCGGSWAQTVGVCVIIKVKGLGVPRCWHTKPTWEGKKAQNDKKQAGIMWWLSQHGLKPEIQHCRGKKTTWGKVRWISHCWRRWLNKPDRRTSSSNLRDVGKTWLRIRPFSCASFHINKWYAGNYSKAFVAAEILPLLVVIFHASWATFVFFFGVLRDASDRFAYP